ncbi:MAG TPA: AraC family transcriptional regulator [Paludibacteraceae bacterium]|nr:AraC family transcriptional regulator [Paludibacteraceae bacterium]
MKLYIKYTLYVQCKKEMLEQLDQLGLHYGELEKGELEITEDVDYDQIVKLKTNLVNSGLELVDDRKSNLVQKIKNVITETIQNTDVQLKTNFSVYLSEKLNYDYTYLSTLFSEMTGVTIEQYLISQRIERVKELLIYDEMNLTQISYLLNYSSVAHLSNQFKKVTGLTPSFFKYMKQRKMIIRDIG